MMLQRLLPAKPTKSQHRHREPHSPHRHREARSDVAISGLHGTAPNPRLLRYAFHETCARFTVRVQFRQKQEARNDKVPQDPSTPYRQREARSNEGAYQCPTQVAYTPRKANTPA